MILLDASGSMSGQSFELAITTVYAILDTLSDNDFVNLIAFSDKTRSVVPCFKDKMVRLHSSSLIKSFTHWHDAILTMIYVTLVGPRICWQHQRDEGCGQSHQVWKCCQFHIRIWICFWDFASGMLVLQFKRSILLLFVVLLNKQRFVSLTQYNQSSQGSQCNQAIMLITDGTTETHSEIIKRYNWPHRPVRIFTYLIGGGSSSRESMHSIACSNKGFYAQINSPEDAYQRVVDYALVMARPMVLYQADHPIHWSPVFVGGPSGNLGDANEHQRRLVTTVSTPVFDRRNHSERAANLLGVAGADVSIEEIVKMVPQYKVSNASSINHQHNYRQRNSQPISTNFLHFSHNKNSLEQMDTHLLLITMAKSFIIPICDFR